MMLVQSTMEDQSAVDVVNSEYSETDVADDKPVISTDAVTGVDSIASSGTGELDLGEEKRREEKQRQDDVEDLGVDSVASSVIREYDPGDINIDTNEEEDAATCDSEYDPSAIDMDIDEEEDIATSHNVTQQSPVVEALTFGSHYITISESEHPLVKEYFGRHL